MFQLQPKLHIRLEERPGRTVLHLSGPLESHSAGGFKKGFRGVMGVASESVDVHVGEVTRMDGMGLASLVWAWREANACGKAFRVTHMRPQVRQLVEQMNLHHVVQFGEEHAPA